MTAAALLIPLLVAAMPQTAGTLSAADPLVGQVWTATHTGAAPGTIRVFLADGTLVMTSCAETYRLSRWSRVSPTRITWDEDGARIDADVAGPNGDALQLRLLVKGVSRTETYSSANVPFTCPSTRPSPSAVNVASGKRDRAPALITPPPAAYRCGEDTFRIAFDAGRAFVTMPDRSVVTLPRTGKAREPGAPRTYTDGRITFVQDTEGTAGSRVRFARGRRALVTCQLQK